MLDASGSMWGQIDGKPKLEIARESLRTVLQIDPGRHRARPHGLWPSRKGHLRGHRADRAAAGRHRQRHHRPPPTSEIPRQDAAVGRRQAGRRSAEIHRGQGDRHPDHRRARDLQCRPLRARQGARAVRRRFHRPCRRLRPDRGRGQAGRLPRRKHRRQIYPGLGRRRRCRTRWSTTVVAPAPEPAPAPAPAPAPEPAKPEFNFVPTWCMAEGGDAAHRAATPGRSTRPRPTARAASNVTTEYDDYKGNLEPGDYVVVARVGEAKRRAAGQDRGRPGRQAALHPECRHADHPSAPERGRGNQSMARPSSIDYPGRRAPATTTATRRSCCRPASRR